MTICVQDKHTTALKTTTFAQSHANEQADQISLNYMPSDKAFSWATYKQHVSMARCFWLQDKYYTTLFKLQNIPKQYNM